MSRETLDWLNTNTLIGFTDKRGNAWHYREGNDNHYAGAVPVEDVLSRLFHWTAEEKPLYVETGIGDNDTIMMPIDGRKAIVRSDNGHVLGIFTDSYTPHQYPEWLVKNITNLLDDELAIGSAGLLKSGAVAWVSVEVPESIETPQGVVFRPNLMASTSLDGSLATTYNRHITNVVCDNTMAVAQNEHGGQRVKVKHSKKSMLRITDARDALGIIHTAAEDFTREVEELSMVKVPDVVWTRVLDALVPVPDEDDNPRGHTMAENKRDILWDLWRDDARVAPWSGTAFGAWQAFNTYQHHSGIVRRNASRPERNMLRAVNGDTEANDRETLSAILAVAS